MDSDSITMPKNIYIYPCDCYIGRAVAKAFSAAGHSVSGFAALGNDAPSYVGNVIRAGDSGATAAHKQLLLTADVVVYDLLGHERATRDAVVHLAQQPYGGREVVFVAVSSPLVWAATRPNPETQFESAAGGEWGAAGEEEGGDGEAAAEGGAAAGGGEGEGEDVPWPGAGALGAAGTGSGDGDEREGENPSAAAAGSSGGAGGTEEGTAPPHTPPHTPPPIAPTFSAPDDIRRRSPATAARAALAVEQVVLRSGRRGRLHTAVVCPGLMYGEGEDDLTFFNAFKAAWIRQCLPPGGGAAAAGAAGRGGGPAPPPPPPRLLVYGRGTNILPTLHVEDMASYVLALAAEAGGWRWAAPGLGPQQLQLGLAPANGAGSAASATKLGSAPATGPSPSSSPPGPLTSGGYYLVTDGSRCSQAELVAAIAAEMGLGEDETAVEYVPDCALHHHPAPLRNRMLLDLSLATSPLPAFTPGRPGGLPAHLAAVAAEFRTARRLTPLRLLVTGPPLSGKTHLARRLAHQYGLSYISVPLLLAAAADPAVAAAAGLNPAMDPSLLRTAQAEVAAGLGGGGKDKDRDKEGGGWLAAGGRVAARTLGALLASALAEPRAAARCRGFVLDGFPRSAAQARAAFHLLQPDEEAAAAAAMAAEQSHAKLGGHKSKGGAAGPAAPGTPGNPGASSDVFEVPAGMRLVPNPLTAPTHVVELDAEEEDLRARLAAIGAAAEEAVTRLSGEVSALSELDKKGAGARKAAGGGPGGAGAKGGGGVPREVALAAALGHNTEAGFVRRWTSYQSWRAEDAEDRRTRIAAAQAAWEAEQARRAEEREREAAESRTLKAKRRRARAAAAAGTGCGGGSGAAGGGDGDNAALGTDGVQGPEDCSAAQPLDAQLPEHGGLMALSLAGGARHARLPNPAGEEGPMVTISVQPPLAVLSAAGVGAAAAAAAAAGPTSIAAAVSSAGAQASAPAPLPPLAALERQVAGVFLGSPHNFDGFPPAAHRSTPTAFASEGLGEEAQGAEADFDVRREAAATAASGSVTGPMAAAGTGAEASYSLRWRGGRGESVRRYLLQHVVPVVTAALAEVALTRIGAGGGGPEETEAYHGGGGKEALLHVARALQAAADAEEAGFVDPYADESYGIQLAKIEAKAAREAARAAAAAAKAEREAAARQQATEDGAA
uniref:adenylate kinase n=1 Tax=Yamagishiella unicocca TaxID=51707 RepID=A0A2Z5X883_9CHLO|nr:flagellar associated protein [Yamagishiella unicocca]